MRADVRTDFNWQAQFAPEIKMLLGLYLIKDAPAHEDRRHNTDFMVLELGQVRVACRVRRPPALHRWPNEFTIRASRPSGQETELDKLKLGWGDYIFYGLADEHDNLAAWVIGDLSVFRRARAKGTPQRNADGTTFMAYDITRLPADFILARKPVRRAAA